MSASDFSLLHLKLDRILAGQDRALAAQAEIEMTVETLTVAMAGLSDPLTVQREMLAKLAEGMSDEKGAIEMRDLIASIQQSLKLILDDAQNMTELLGKLPTVVSRAVQEGIRSAMGDAVDTPDSGLGGGA